MGRYVAFSCCLERFGIYIMTIANESVANRQLQQ